MVGHLFTGLWQVDVGQGKQPPGLFFGGSNAHQQMIAGGALFAEFSEALPSFSEFADPHGFFLMKTALASGQYVNCTVIFYKLDLHLFLE